MLFGTFERGDLRGEGGDHVLALLLVLDYTWMSKSLSE